MREILFRGKRLDNGEWVHGDLQQWLDAVYISSDNKGWYSKTNYLVNAVTVGQYTGLTDKNGTKIFEGDILAIKFHPEYVNRICWQGPPDAIAEVHWDFSGFGLKATNGIDRRYPDLVEANFKETEVIGNIHDNPELLKGGATE